MCGICGVFSFDGARRQEDGAEALRHMVDQMVRRGPDDEGLWGEPGGHLQLGFRRLSILDLSPAAHQPMLTDDGRYALVCNGEIYNFRELRKLLEQSGVRFRSSGDAEVVLHALAHWGPPALERLNGMFALAFYDVKQKLLLLARDHAGIKPLYYALTPKGLLFGSQYDQILSHPWCQGLAISDQARAIYLRLGYIPAPHAYLQGTHMLEPGAWVQVSATGELRRGSFFSFPASREPDLRGQEACEAVDAAVAASVRRQMISDVPLGAFLSGGIDSPLIAAKCQAASPEPVWALTMGMSGDPEDESADAASYARQLGLHHHLEQVTSGDVLAKLDSAMQACSEPLATHSIIPSFAISEAARRRVKVMLSGDGGDELFWGYAGRFISGLGKSKHRRSPYWLRKLRHGVRIAVGRADGPGEAPWRTVGEWYRFSHSSIPEPWLSKLFPTLPAWPSGFRLFDQPGGPADEVAQWFRWNEFVGHLTMVLLKVDRASMHHGLEVRVPLLDREVIEVAQRIDWRSCLDTDHRIGKLPLRYALARHTGSQSRGKRGFGIPVGDWFRDALRPLFESVVLSRRELMGLPLDRAAAAEFYQRHISGRKDFGAALWLLLSTSLWEDRHFLPRARAPVRSAYQGAGSAPAGASLRI